MGAESVLPWGVKAVSELIQWINSGLNGRSPWALLMAGMGGSLGLESGNVGQPASGMGMASFGVAVFPKSTFPANPVSPTSTTLKFGNSRQNLSRPPIFPGSKNDMLSAADF